MKSRQVLANVAEVDTGLDRLSWRFFKRSSNREGDTQYIKLPPDGFALVEDKVLFFML